MLMWVMSDRAIPRSFRFMEGFGVHTFRFVNAARAVDVREVPLEAEAGHAVGAVGRGREDQRRRPRLPPTRPLERDQQRRLPGVGARRPGVRRRASPTSSSSTCSIRPSSSPRRCCRSGRSAGWCSIAWSTTSSPRPSRSRSARRTSCRGSTSRTTRCSRAATSPTSTRSSSGSAGPNFTHIPVNAPKCPMAHFQQDGHMAMMNPVGRVNFEPNSYTGAERGPREDPDGGFASFAAEEGGPKRRLRASSFADHYSQAGLFYRSQTAVEQQHIVDAFTFELSKVEQPDHPRADGRQPAQRRRGPRRPNRIGARHGKAPAGIPRGRRTEPITRSRRPQLSILENGPSSFAGRKVGVLVTDGAPAKAVKALAAAVKAEKATLEVIAPDDHRRRPRRRFASAGATDGRGRPVGPLRRGRGDHL